jgi:hypothetical protein
MAFRHEKRGSWLVRPSILADTTAVNFFARVRSKINRLL